MASRKAVIFLVLYCVQVMTSLPTGIGQQSPGEGHRPDRDLRDESNRDSLQVESSVGFVPLYVIFSSSIIPRFVYQKNPTESQLQDPSDTSLKEIQTLPPGHPPVRVDDKLLKESSDADRNPSEQMLETKQDIGQNQDSGQEGPEKKLIDPGSIDLPEGHPPVTAEQLRTGVVGPESNLKKEPNSDLLAEQDSGKIHDSGQELLDKDLINPNLIDLPEGHPPITDQQLRTGLVDPQPDSSKESTGDMPDKSVVEFPAERPSEQETRDEERSKESLDIEQKEKMQDPMDLPRALPRQERDIHLINYQMDPYLPYDEYSLVYNPYEDQVLHPSEPCDGDWINEGLDSEYRLCL